MNIEIIYQDEFLIAVNKPAGMLTHPTRIDPYEKLSLVGELKNQFQKDVFTIHRLDKPTAGVMIFGFDSATAKTLADQFENRSVDKIYLAVCRGHLKSQQMIDHPLRDKIEISKIQPAKTAFTEVTPVAHCEIPVSVDKYPTSRYTLVKARPLSGRSHQIRRHLKHLNHPVIGDVNYGSSAHNRYFEGRFKHKGLFLACTQLQVNHPQTGSRLQLKASLPPFFTQAVNELFPSARDLTT